jgi:D-3-phosphoglycerate dehydrogenase
MRILVTEPLDDAGLILLRQQATVDVRLNLPREELLDRAGDYEAIITRSGTPVDRALLDAGTALRVIGRASAWTTSTSPPPPSAASPW